MARMSQSTVALWLKAASAHVGVDLALDDGGHCRFVLSDESECVLEVPPGSDLLFLYLPVMPVPEDATESARMLKAALALNLFGLLTQGAVFGYDERTEQLLLSACGAVSELNEDAFFELLGSFLEVAMRTKATFVSLAPSPEQ